VRMRRSSSSTAAALWLLVTLGIVVLTGVARRTRWLPGERMLARHGAGLSETPLHTVAHWLDVGLNDSRATVVFLVGLGAVAMRWGSRSAWWWLWAGACTVVIRAVDLAQRPRPTSDGGWGEYVAGYGGFPSGHVVYVVVLAWTAALRARLDEGDSTVRPAVYTVAALLVIAVGPARIITNDHWAGDVVGGYLVAGWFVLSGWLLAPGIDALHDRIMGRFSVSAGHQDAARPDRAGERRRRRALRA